MPSIPTETIYARVPADLRIGERLRALLDTEEYRYRRYASIGLVVADLLDKSLPPIAPPAPAPKKTAKKGRAR